MVEGDENVCEIKLNMVGLGKPQKKILMVGPLRPYPPGNGFFLFFLFQFLD